MHLNLTLPGLGGGGRRHPAKGKIINADPKKTAEEEAEEIWRKSVNPSTANRALYDRHTGSRTRTQDRTMTGASETLAAAAEEPSARSTVTGVYVDRDKGTVHKRSKLGMVSRALKRLTGS